MAYNSLVTVEDVHQAEYVKVVRSERWSSGNVVTFVVDIHFRLAEPEVLGTIYSV